jgi:hypothetical protein
MIVAALVASVSAFTPSVKVTRVSTTELFQEKPNMDWNTAAELGWSMGGEDYTRSVQPKEDKDDPRKTIHEGPSFEEYMKSRQNSFGQ